MRKIILPGIVCLALTTFFYCSKSSNSQPERDLGTTELIETEILSVDCNCGANQSSCSADCLWTACCICYNATTHEAGCSCSWGFSSCRSEPYPPHEAKLASGEQGPIAIEETSHPVTVYYERIPELFQYFEESNIDFKQIKIEFSQLQSKATGYFKHNDTKFFKVDSRYYDKFLGSYETLVKSLNAKSLTNFETFIAVKKSLYKI